MSKYFSFFDESSNMSVIGLISMTSNKVHMYEIDSAFIEAHLNAIKQSENENLDINGILVFGECEKNDKDQFSFGDAVCGFYEGVNMKDEFLKEDNSKFYKKYLMETVNQYHDATDLISTGYENATIN
jgi:hypothetical protein